MRLPTEIFLLSLAVLQHTTTTAAPLDTRSSSFLAFLGLTPLSKDHSSFATSHPAKFFHESTFSSHYDGRFASAELPRQARQFHLRLMLKAYMDSMQRMGIRTWLMHGCLLGWWWNGQIMPWDTDIDVMVDEHGMRELGGWWNMTVHQFDAPDLGISLDPDLKSNDTTSQMRTYSKLLEEVSTHGKKYLLEINPHYSNTSTTDRLNVIDARWIDVATGLFIDITTLHIQPISNPTAASLFHHASDAHELELYTKDQHAYSSTQLFPLRTSTFENIEVKVPFAYEEVLLDEYGTRAVTQRVWKGWIFDGVEWVRKEGEARVESAKALLLKMAGRVED
jgi:hypothetical protein